MKRTILTPKEILQFERTAMGYELTVTQAQALYLEWHELWSSVALREMREDDVKRRQARKRARKGEEVVKQQNDEWERKFWRDLRRIHKTRCAEFECHCRTSIEDMLAARKRGLSSLEAAKELA